MEIGEEKIENQGADQLSYDGEDSEIMQSEGNPPLSIWHLILIFLGGIAVCAVFFALGFLIGKNQGKMEQIIASGSKESAAQSGLGQNSTFSTPGQKAAGAPSAPGGRLEFYDEVTRSAKPDPSAAGGAERPAGAAENKESQLPAKIPADAPPTATSSAAVNSGEFSSALNTTVAPPPAPTGKSSEVGSESEATEVAEKAQPKAKEANEVFRVQMGAFLTQDEAQNLVLELEGKKFEAFIEPPVGRADPYYRVQMGPFSTNAKAVDMVGRLKKAGFNAMKRKY